MPGSFSNAIITTAGAALLARVEAGQATMEVTKVAVGDGLYSAAERTAASLSTRTSLKAQKNIYTPSSATVMSEDSIKIKTIFSNYDAVEQVPVVTRGYFINELAVYCKENGGAASTEVLYCIAVTSGVTGNYMPAYVGGGASQIIQDIFLTVGIAATTYVNKAGAAFLATEGQALKSEVASIKTRAESNTSAITALDTRVNGLIGSATPTPVATVAQMTDTSIIYVYTGSETGYTPGDWYYYDGSSSSWKSGGEYGAALIDPTLSQEGQAADAKKTGDKIAALNEDLNYATDVKMIPLTKGYYVKPSGNILDIDHPVASQQGWAYGIMECTAGDEFCVNGESYNGTYPLAWCFLSSDKTVLASAAQNITVENKILTAPLNSAYIVIHCKSPYTPSYKGLSAPAKIEVVDRNFALYREGKELLEFGGFNDTTGYKAVGQNTSRIRTVNFLSLDAYNYFAINYGGLTPYIYAYDHDYGYLGMEYNRRKKEWYASEIITYFPTAKYIKVMIFNSATPSMDLADLLPAVQDAFVCKKITGGGDVGTTPELSTEQKNAIKSLADDYLGAVDNFTYYSSATINDYVTQTRAMRNGKYKICCSLLAELLWMGRSADDYASLENYTNEITKEFDWGYNFAFADRPLYGLKPQDGYYGFYNQFADEGYAGSYSWNSYYSSAATSLYKQVFNPFLYANDMAKEMERLGYTVSMPELQTGDLIFTQYPAFDPKKDTFDAVAYKHISHVAIVYEKTDSSIAIIESTPRFTDAIHLSRSTGTDEEKVRIGYLLNTAVCFARHPAAWGNGGNVPQSIETR